MVENPGLQIHKVRDSMVKTKFSWTLEAANVTLQRTKKDRYKNLIIRARTTRALKNRLKFRLAIFF